MVQNETRWLYLKPFTQTKEFLHLADISRQLKEPHPTVRKYLNSFEKEGLLIKDIKGRLTLFKLNRDHPLIIDYLTIIEKEVLIKRCKKNLIINEIVSNCHIGNTLIFGSASNSNKFNDIDLLTTSEINKTNIEEKINKKIHIIKVKSLNEVNNSLKNEIFKKHLIINGSEEIIKWLL